MSISYNFTSLAIGIAVAVIILLLVRKDLMHSRYSLWWLLMALAIAVFGCFPRLVDRIAYKLGVHYGPVLLIVVGMALILIKMLTMDVERSDQERRLRLLTQRLAILEGEKNANPEKEEKTETSL
ncbi:MAG: DUF2304 domain-containing protein [Pseudomonadota bacterium]